MVPRSMRTWLVVAGCIPAAMLGASVPWVLQSGPGGVALMTDSRLTFHVPRPADLPSVASGQTPLGPLVKRGERVWYFTAPLEGEPFGVPAEVFTSLVGPRIPIGRAPLFGLVDAFQRSGLFMVPGESLPRGLVETGTTERLVTQNCSACHSGVVEGQLIPGVGNKWYNQRAIIQASRGMLKAAIPLLRARPDARGRALEQQTRKQLDKLERYDALYSTGCKHLAPGMITAARIWQLSSQLLTDPKQLEGPAGAADFPCGATKPPPLNTLRFRNLLFWDGSVNSLWVAHWPMFDFFGFNQYERWERKVRSPDIEAMDALVVFGTPSPSWKTVMRTPVDGRSAQRGHAVFHRKNMCASCHGEYDPAGMLKGFRPGITPLQEIGTDPERTLAATDKLLSRFTPYGWASVPRLEGKTEYPPGYANSPLCSTFLNFPYLHTGAVANLWELLLPQEQRSTRWWQTDFTNKQDVGYFVTNTPPPFPNPPAPPSGPFPRVLPRPPRVELRQFPRDHVMGHSGAAYGTQLGQKEKRDLVEYLKTLQCPEEAGAFQ